MTLVIYADDLVGCLKDELSRSEYRLHIDALTCQYKSKFRKLNTTKTKVKS